MLGAGQLKALQAVVEPVFLGAHDVVAGAQGLRGRLEAEFDVVVVPVGWAFAGRLEAGDRFLAQGVETGHHGGVLEVAVDFKAGQQTGVRILPGVVVRGIMEAPGRVILAIQARYLDQVIDVEADDDCDFFPGL
ncbi:hypothetical protein D3C77_377050 [compost metagenome]